MSAPLQQEIGRTEHALTALLVEHVLADAPFRTSDEWAAVNLLERIAPADASAWRALIADVLSMTDPRADEIATRLCASGIVVDSGQGLTLDDETRRSLAAGRTKSAHVAAEIDRRVAPDEREITVGVLATVRDVVREIRQHGFPSSV